MGSANLYLDEVDFLKYLNRDDCHRCGFPTCQDFLEAIRSGLKTPHDCIFLNDNKAYALETVCTMNKLWPEVPLLLHPRPSQTGLVEINSPDPQALLLITGNNEYTEEILLTVLSTTVCPFFVLFTDTDGNTVDMALIYQTMTAERIQKALEESDAEKRIETKQMIIPGLAFALKDAIQTETGWNVTTGPRCAAELPLFLSHIWIPPE